MVESWIKVRVGLPHRRETIAIARALKIAPEHALGLVVAFWMWVDGETEDGLIPGITYADIDTMLRAPGFAAALDAVGWLRRDDTCVAIPNFERHLSRSAKRRAEDARRRAASRWEARR